MIDYCVYYGENGEKCVVDHTDPSRYSQKLPPGARWGFPDEVKLIGLPLIKREKTMKELRAAGLTKKYRQYSPFAAKDIPLHRAGPKESN